MCKIYSHTNIYSLQNNVYLRMKNLIGIKNTSESRKEAIRKLEFAIQNPGRFSVLLIGERGSGKSHWLYEISKAHEKKLHTVHPAFAEESQEYWLKQFTEADGGILAIDEAETLSKNMQDLIRQIMSTNNGCFGLNENLSDKKLAVQVVFISSRPISALRESEDVWLHSFFNRIGQIIVEMPSLRSDESFLWKHFLATWDKMKFIESKNPSERQIEQWLFRNYENLHGNFRDLDKLSINLDFFIKTGLSEAKAWEKTVEDFEKLFHSPEQIVHKDLVFEFERGKSKQEIELVFRSKFKTWAKNEFGSLQKAAKQLGCSVRTFEKW
jgi:DNA-binding NtrC family response regulator